MRWQISRSGIFRIVHKNHPGNEWDFQNFLDLYWIKMNKVDITAFIRELLFGHDCVAVPGFGGFIGNYVPARIDKSSGTFYPPVKQISFNRNLNHNDGLLIKQISAGLGVNYGDAREMVTEFVARVMKRLGNGETVVFDRIGSFVTNHEGNLEFEPDRSVNYHVDSYGLESFHYQAVQPYDVRKKISARNIGEPVRHVSLRKYLWRAAVLIPVAAAIIAVSVKTDLFKARVESGTMNPLVSAEFENNRAALEKETLTEPEKGTEAVISKDTAAIIIAASAEAPSLKSVTSAAAYYIITGSFQSEENAGKQVSQLQSEGFNPEVIKAANGFYRVCAVACPDLETAISKKDSILDKFPGAWVSRKK
jgi:hypothetical protein